jgi:ATP-dependent DNA helicase RecG
MSAQQLVFGLRSCLAEAMPEPETRRALAESLRAWAGAHGAVAPLIGDAAAVIERANSRRELAVAAAQAMRLLMQEQTARDDEASEPPPKRRSSRERAQARAEREQSRALSEPTGKLAPAERPVEALSGVGPALGLALRARGVRTAGELAWLLPLGYHDERTVVSIAQLREGERQVSEGRVVSARVQPRGRGRRVAEVLLESIDAPGQGGARLRLVWFRAPQGLLARFREGERFRVAGLVERFGGAFSMTHPQTERLGGGEAAQAAGIVPRYPPVPGVPPKTLVRAVARAVALVAPSWPDAVPAELRAEHALPSLGDTLRALHAPPAQLDAEALARWNEQRTEHHARLAFEEFFLLELALHKRRSEEFGVAGEALAERPQATARARAALGFALTAAQARVVEEICAELRTPQPMRRLLQGDVGSGKTAVAMLAAAHAISAGAQVAFMAPTEVLAEQHFRALAPLSQAMGLRAALMLGGERASHRRRARKELSEGRIDLVVGTHALLSEGVEFARLRLAIVDEQHRFGVGQRLRLVDKAGGLAPHLLVMTATPIPRSLALALHGDLQASVLDEMPPGRVPPLTRAYRSSERGEALRQLERGLDTGGSAFVICPAIEPNEETGVRSALEAFDDLAARFARFGVALLHGQLAPEQKQQAMERFTRGEARVLVSTTIVEVGVDVPNANVILIEHAERFGLAQLHQLRGRVGRAGQRSACLLVHEAASEEARERVRILCECSDGFRIAEEDLRLRGPGELFGRKQSGLPGFRYGDLRRDLPLLQRAQALAQALIARDPELAMPVHEGARRALAALAESDRAVVKEEAG